MTTEDDFQRHLDADPDDFHTRLVFADFLQERDDPRAEGYRALGVLGRVPYAVISSWWQAEHLPVFTEAPQCALEADWHELVRLTWKPQRRTEDGLPFDTRREAEDAAALAFAKLPEARRRELLNPPVPA